MEQKNRYLYAARLIIFSQVLIVVYLIFFIPFVLYEMITHETVDPTIKIWSIIIKFILVLSIVLVKISRGQDKIVMEKLMKQHRQKIDRAVEKLKSQCSILDIHFEHEPGYFTLVLNQGILKTKFANTIPLIKINGLDVTIQKAHGNEIKCRAPVISATSDFLSFSLDGIEDFEIKNPYKLELKSERILWQTKGHSKELRLYIPAVDIPNIRPQISYAFDIVINRDTFGPFYGVLHEKLSVVIIFLTHIPRNCEVNKCLLQAHHDKSYQIALPKPAMVLINGMVNQSLFKK